MLKWTALDAASFFILTLRQKLIFSIIQFILFDMSKFLFCFIFTALSLNALQAQTAPCQPDPLYKDSLAGVYPLPYDAINYPTGGVNKPACIGKPYSLVFTVKVTDSVTVKVLGQNTTIPVDSVSVEKTGAILGLPTGLSYACNPPNCVFKKRTSGCVVVSGTAATTNPIKIYPLTIAGRFHSDFFILFTQNNYYDVTFPSSLFPGKYDLSLLAANDAKCTASATNDLADEITNVRNYPNPFGGQTEIRIESKVSGQFSFEVYDLVGKRVGQHPLSIQVGLNTFGFDASELPNGIYTYTISKGTRLVSNKFVVNRN